MLSSGSILQCTAAKTHSELSVRYVGGASPLICGPVDPFRAFGPHVGGASLFIQA